MGAVTLADVAILAGVSQPTASRVLNGSTRKPAAHVVEAVRKAADELGYIANAQAQALARASSGLLGLVVQDIADPFFSVIAAGVQETADQEHRQLMLAVTARSPERELAAAQTFIAHRADAIVLTGSPWSSRSAGRLRTRLRSDLDRYVDSGGRVAVIGKSLPGAHAVILENRRGAAALGQALTAHGAKDFLVAAGPAQLTTAQDRTAGFIGALGDRGLEPVGVAHSDLTRDGGYAAASELLTVRPRRKGRAPVVFAVTDLMALGVMAAIRDAGLRIPDDVQVAGFDDIPTLRDHTPGLTTVRLPLHDMGRRAATFALSQGSELFTHRVFGEVVLRGSTLQSAPDALTR
jgi:LacI family transcriptional regulator